MRCALNVLAAAWSCTHALTLPHHSPASFTSVRGSDCHHHHVRGCTSQQLGAGTSSSVWSLRSRRHLLLSAGAVITAAMLPAEPSFALVKGSAPPPKMSAPKERKCKSIDECEALGEKKEQEMLASERTDYERTSGGDRFRDLAVGSGKAAAEGDAVAIRYRVMRLGTRARDGLSGEGQTIFSLGFGEDEDSEGDTLPVVLSGSNLVAGVKAALVGMQPGGRRRVLVRPERGWRDLSGQCAEGQKSLGLEAAQRTSAQTSNLVFKADIGAAIENTDACQNKISAPQPRSYGARARFGRRFDESLLVEVDLVGFADSKAVASSSKKGSSFVYDKCYSNPFAEGCDDATSSK